MKALQTTKTTVGRENGSGLRARLLPPLEQTVQAKGLGHLLLRPISTEDEPLMVRFHQALSEETVYKRYFEHIRLESRIKHDRLLKVCTNTDDSFALIVVRPEHGGRPAAILGVVRLSTTPDPETAEFALVVCDEAQGHGIGSAMMQCLVAVARFDGFKRLTAEVLLGNPEMLFVCRQLGFSLHTITDDGVVKATLDL